MIIYGIKNCDTMQKAFKYLDKRKIKYAFHNYKTDGIDELIIRRWLKHLPTEKIINTKSLTFKKLTTEEQACISNKAKAIGLMVSNTSLIKRPILALGDEKFLLGFNQDEWDKAFQ